MMNGTAKASAIVDAMVAAGKYPGLSPAQINAIKQAMAIAETARVTYIKDNMEVIGVQVSTGAGFLNSPAPLVPVPTDGGAAVSAQMVGNTTNKIISQTGQGSVR
jgi:hypothetical protein